MTTRRYAAFVLSLVFALGVFSPSGAACMQGGMAAVSTHSSGQTHHPEQAAPSQHLSHDKAPCTSHDSDCCSAMASCAGLSFTGNANRVVVPAESLQAIRSANLIAPATPPLSVEPPPPRA